MTSATVAAQADLDERILAQSALDAAEDNLQSLCASHAGTFVQVERRGKSLEQGLAELLEHLDQVQKHTTETQELLQQDEDQSGHPTLATLAEQHRVRRRTLLQHSSLLELLELPSLMDACVRSHLYDEALSIAGLANTLERRSSDSDNKGASTSGNNNNSSGWLVVRQVVEQIRQRQEDLRQQLWQRLSQASVTLPDCLEVVTALRRLNAIDLERQAQNLEAIHAGMEVQLQIDFLEARDVWLETTTTRSSSAATAAAAAAAGGGVTEDLLDTIERYRTRVFEIATQFNAIFRAHHATPPSQGSLLSSVALLRLWMSRRVESFLHVLETQLNSNVSETSHLRDALEAALFFATSLGRLGADFTARLPALFEPVLLQIITASWKDGAKQLAETLVTCREAGVATPLATGSTDTVESAPESTNTASDEEGQPMRPPRMLLNYPPLARFVNAILMGLNELRRCLLPGVVGRLRMALGEVLATVRQDLIAHERAVHVPGMAKGPQTTQLRQVSVQYKEILTTIIEPYAWGSLHAAVGNVTDAQAQYQTLQTNLQPPVKEEEKEEKKEEKVEEKADEDEEEGKDEEEVATSDDANAQDSQEQDSQELDGQELDGQELDGQELDGQELDGQELDGQEQEEEIEDGAAEEGEETGEAEPVDEAAEVEYDEKEGQH